jgi:hypothetical protein
VHQSHDAGLVQLVQRVLAGSLVGTLVVASNSGRHVFQVRGEDGLRAKDEEERGESGGPAWGGPETPHNRWQLLDPFSTRLVQSVEKSGLRPCRIMLLPRST